MQSEKWEQYFAGIVSSLLEPAKYFTNMRCFYSKKKNKVLHLYLKVVILNNT